MILNILGGGGSGKTTLKFALLQLDGFVGYVSYTTRPRRPTEQDGVHYHFVSEDQFHSLSTLILKRKAGGYLYGIDAKDLFETSPDKVLVTTFDVEGIRTLESLGQEIRVVFLNISECERKRRMLERGDHPSEIEKRIARVDRGKFVNLDFGSSVIEIKYGSVTEIVEQILQFLG